MKLNYLFTALAVLFLVSCADDTTVDRVDSTSDPAIATNRSENAELTTRLERIDGYLKGTDKYNYQLSSFLDDASLLMNLRYAREKQNTGQTLITDCVSFTASDTDFISLYINLWESLKTIHEGRENEAQYIRSIYFEDNSSDEDEEVCIKVVIATEGTNTGGGGVNLPFGTTPNCDADFSSGNNYNWTSGGCSSMPISDADYEIETGVNNIIAQNPNVTLTPQPPYQITGYTVQELWIVADWLTINSGDINPEDNDIDYRIFRRSEALPNYGGCLTSEQLSYYYCEAIKLVYESNPNPWTYLIQSIEVQPDGIPCDPDCSSILHRYIINYTQPIYVWGPTDTFDSPTDLSLPNL